ncbi:MAG: response regulator [Verrucomicrobiaceae bacterium]|nr:response regulator [Verrucomicrobiaceae bacterium]
MPGESARVHGLLKKDVGAQGWLGTRTGEQVTWAPLDEEQLLPKPYWFWEAGLSKKFKEALDDRRKKQAAQKKTGDPDSDDDVWIQREILDAEKARGHHISALQRGSDLIRIMCAEEKDVADTRKRVEGRLRERFGEAYEADWGRPVACSHVVMQMARFEVTHEGRPSDWYRFAYCIFREELAAGLDKEMMSMTRHAISLSAGAGLLAFLLGWVMVRPIVGITRTARKVADSSSAHHGMEDSESRLLDHIEELRSILPKSRRDEAGEIAKALDRLLLEVLNSTGRLRQARADLEHINTSLEEQVDRRTQELKDANEQLLSLSKEKDSFLASVSHELRQPLNSIYGFLQLLEMSPLDDQQQKDVSRAINAYTYLKGLIDDILDYQKIIMGGLSLEPEPIQAVEFFDQLQASLENQAREKNNSLVFNISKSLGTLVNDRTRLQQVLVNLLTNACKFTDNGTISLGAERQPDKNGRDWLVIKVGDSGRGMTPEQLANLFVKFKKLASREGNRSGSGLGLVISKGLCTLMGGGIEAESEAGKGSVFTVRVPVVVGDVDAELHAQPPPPASSEEEKQEVAQKQLERLSGMRVLVIDDDPVMLDMVRRFLATHDCTVFVAGSGEEGVELARLHQPDVITLDVVMPGWSGWETLTRLKSDPRTAEIPVIVATFMEQAAQGYSLGAVDYLVKPIEWSRLGQILARHARAGSKVLVIDDDAALREITRRTMEKEGWNVLEAQHGEEALLLLEKEVPSLILLDLLMPVMDGFQFITLLRNDPRWAGIPVIVITAIQLTDVERARLSGSVSTILQKTKFTLDDLLEQALQSIKTAPKPPCHGQDTSR